MHPETNNKVTRG